MAAKDNPEVLLAKVLADYDSVRNRSELLDLAARLESELKLQACYEGESYMTQLAHILGRELTETEDLKIEHLYLVCRDEGRLEE